LKIGSAWVDRRGNKHKGNFLTHTGYRPGFLGHPIEDSSSRGFTWVSTEDVNKKLNKPVDMTAVERVPLRRISSALATSEWRRLVNGIALLLVVSTTKYAARLPQVGLREYLTTSGHLFIGTFGFCEVLMDTFYMDLSYTATPPVPQPTGHR